MDSLQPILGEDPVFLAALEHVSRLAPIERPCLVIGERGSGKELISARLHYLSRRWGGPLVKVNCAALSETLLDTELFGHEAGAFTGATKRHVGRFERAHGGTIILDEIATASPVVQEKLLRVVEYGEIERVGGSDVIDVDTRVIGVTNENLRELAKTGKFRADLLDRLAFDVIAVPPLRQRTDDILLLAEQFALDMTKRLGRTVFAGFSRHAAEQLLRHDWPGNIRELRNAVERSIYLADDDTAPLATITLDPFEGIWSETDRITGSAHQSTNSVAPKPAEANGTLGTIDFKSQVADFEITLLKQALAQNANNQTEAAKALDLNYHQFRRLLEKHGLLPER
ncbi:MULTISPECIES: phage shock protein operon transcriptional activator [Thalassospira]|uniref:Phage shock protein n=2 Tax=Thalassospira TaxID=168934 RepID=A0A367VXE4_9PROT|nr:MULTISPECIES: phage shock protein operon transcriptional activator [Thalassospira]MDG4721508.1 phage shock protein operon transcriptional activator [Thalassospira sp. FZY0004]RCK30353.1 phage shock protein [Thalassospira profundimaris]